MSHMSSLLAEALIKGVVAIPAWALTAALLPRMNAYGKVFVAAAALHIASEYSGANDWAVRHSVAATKVKHWLAAPRYKMTPYRRAWMLSGPRCCLVSWPSSATRPTGCCTVRFPDA